MLSAVSTACLSYRDLRVGLQVLSPTVSLVDVKNQIVAVEKGELLFVFSFNYQRSFPDYRVPVKTECCYRCILSVKLDVHSYD